MNRNRRWGIACVLLAFTASACEWVTSEGEVCGDGLDNDGNGRIDCQDPACGYEGPAEISCGDGRDNDCDALVDAADPDCAAPLLEDCDDGIDNDGDGAADCDDPDCSYLCTPGQSWTVLLYMVGDNNLEPAAADDLAEMMAVGSGPGFTIAAQLDRSPYYTSDGFGGIADWTTAKRIVVREGYLEEVADLGELNMGDPAVLSDFIAWGTTAYPADRYAIVFWDHGGAWPGFGGDESTPDIDALTLAELESGLGAGIGAGGFGRFSFLGFDACLMGTFEVALAMSGYSDTMLGSQELEPGHGWDYRGLAAVRANPSLGPADLGGGLMDGFQAQAVEQRQEQEITLALTDLHRLADVAAAVSGFSAALQADLPSYGVVAAQERTQVEEYGKMADPTQSVNMVDLVDFAQLVAAQAPALSGAAQAVAGAVEEAVMRKVSGPLRPNANGLSVYFPPHRAYYNPSYDAVTSAEAWRPYLLAQLDFLTTDISGPVFTNPDKIATVETTETYAVISGQLDPSTAGDLADIYFSVGVGDASDNFTLYGNYPAAFDAGTSIVSYQWDYTTLRVRQGTISEYGYIDIYPAEGGMLEINIPLVYTGMGETAASYTLWDIVFDPAAGTVVQSAYFMPTGEAWSELRPRPGSTFHTMLMVLPPAGDAYWIDTSTVFDAMQPLETVFEVIPYGATIMVSLTAVDIGGNHDTVWYVGVM
jgi:hypothetical protein